MAILGVNQVQRAPQKEEEKKPALIDQILKGLGAVNALTGIGSNTTAIQNNLLNSKLKEQQIAQADRLSSGNFASDIEASRAGLTPAQPGTPGSFNASVNGEQKSYITTDQAKINAEQAITAAQQKAANAKNLREATDSYRKEYQSNPTTQKTREISIAKKNVEDMVKNPKRFGDISLITGFMKILDPTSVVREGEFKTAASAGSYEDRLAGIINSIRTGQRLTPELRDDLLKTVDAIAGNQFKAQSAFDDFFLKSVNNAGVDPQMVIQDFGQSAYTNQLSQEPQQQGFNPSGQNVVPVQQQQQKPRGIFQQEAAKRGL